MPERIRYTVTRLGAEGHGVGRAESAPDDGAPVFLPLTCPGDIAEADPVSGPGGVTRGENIRVLTPSPLRVTPPCPDYGRCGGCSLQHVNAETYGEFKFTMVRRALELAGADPDFQPEPLVTAGPAARRRASFKIVTKNDGERRLGFSSAGGGEIVVPSGCLTLTPALTEAVARIPDLLRGLKPRDLPTEVALLADEHTGADVTLIYAARPAAGVKKLLTERAALLPALHRLSCRSPEGAPESLSDKGGGAIRFGDVPVKLPPGGFVQAWGAGAELLTKLTLEAAQDARSAADLFCGAGAYALPLLRQGKRVLAAEGEPESVTALFNAARRAGLEHSLTTRIRDLVRSPVGAQELSGYAFAVMNPPRTGGLAQAKEIAASAIQSAAVISCNPRTFAAEAGALIKGGFRLIKAVPIDQFTWTPHLEIFASFRR